MLEEMKHKLAKRRQNCDDAKPETSSLNSTPTKVQSSSSNQRMREDSPAKMLSPINKIANASLSSLKKVEILNGARGIELVQNYRPRSPSIEKQELVIMKEEILKEIRAEIHKSKHEIIALIREEIKKIHQ